MGVDITASMMEDFLSLQKFEGWSFNWNKNVKKKQVNFDTVDLMILKTIFILRQSEI